jgi:molybdate transport system ATP-binding protein
MMSSAPTISVALDGQLGSFKLRTAFAVPAEGITALFGPSGSGKTAVLRSIAGLQRLPGRIAVGDAIWQDTDTGIFLAPHRRRVGYVFQEASLFPHLNVRDNLLYGASRADKARSGGGLALDGIVRLLGIAHLLERSPAALSGGERQRVAVGRALLSRPDILLMDEPLSALDRMTKGEILPYFEMLHETVALPILYVSHDLGEIERLADTIILLEAGRVVAGGPLADLQTDPHLPLLTAAEASVVLNGRITEVDSTFGLTRFAIDGGELIAPGICGTIGHNSRLRVTASDVSLSRTAATDSTILNRLPARIESISLNDSAAQANVVLRLGVNGHGCRIVARITRKSVMEMRLAVGEPIIAQVKGVALLASRSRSRVDFTTEVEPA